MKKILLALPFVATASWAGTTLYTGSQSRTAYDDLLAQLDASTTLSVSAESYDAGFMSSSAITRVRFSDAAEAKVLFRLRHEIAHSPVGVNEGRARVGAARIVTTLLTDTLDDDILELLGAFEGGEPFVLDSDVDFAGRASHALRIAPVDLAGEGGATLRFDGANYTIDAETEKHLAGTGTFGEITFDDPTTGMRVTVAPGTDRFELDWVQEGVFTGGQQLDPGTVRIESTGMALTLDDMRVESINEKIGERLSSEFIVSAGSIASTTPLPLDAASFGTRVDGIDLAGLRGFIDGFGDLSERAFDTMAPEKQFREIGALYGMLVSPGLSLAYDIAFSNPGGEVTASLGGVFEGDGSASGHDAMTTIGELLRGMRLTASLDADADAVAMTPAAMFLMGDQLAPWIVSDADGYRSALVVDDLIVDVNGEALSLQDMAGELMSLPLDLSLLANMASGGAPFGR